MKKKVVTKTAKGTVDCKTYSGGRLTVDILVEPEDIKELTRGKSVKVTWISSLAEVE